MRRNLVYKLLLLAVAALLGLTTRRRHSGLRNVPKSGGVIVVCNHISVADPGVLAAALAKAGRLPRGMATAGLFNAPVVGTLFRIMGHIPVLRGTSSAAAALAPAMEALSEGELLVIYPEGGISTGDQWLRPLKTGAARLALSTGAPVVPVAQWGIQRVLPPASKSKLWRPMWAVVTRPKVHVLLGEPFTLAGDPDNIEDVRSGTARIETEIRALLAQLRGHQPDTAATGRPTDTAA